MTSRGFVVEDHDGRVDLFLARQGLDLTRSQVRRLMEQGHVLLNGRIARPSRKLRPGDRISVTVPPPEPVTLSPEAIPLSVVYEDGEIIVVDKPAGIAVHPAPGHPSHTLVNALLAHCPDLKGIGGELRPGIVHRLDKDTSGLLLVAKSSAAHVSISRQLQDRKVRKGYLALASGQVVPREGAIDAPIGRDPWNRKRMAVVQGGREAFTSYRVLNYLRQHSYMEVFPKTGRTHQIRVHLASAGHPIMGDALYGKRSSILGRQFLHAHLLEFRHPSTDEGMEVTSPLPEDLRLALDTLSGGEEMNPEPPTSNCRTDFGRPKHSRK